MFDNKTIESSDEGVSSVIGVILMVAITVILVAVIGTFVLDLAGNLHQNTSASVTFDENTNNGDYYGSAPQEEGQVNVQIISMQNADFVEVRASADNGDPVNVGPSGGDGGYEDLGGTASDGTDNTGDNDLGSVFSSGVVTYGDASNGTTASGSITIVGYLEGQGSVLQTYSYGG